VLTYLIFPEKKAEKSTETAIMIKSVHSMGIIHSKNSDCFFLVFSEKFAGRQT
jgi:hypothetical protein